MTAKKMAGRIALAVSLIATGPAFAAGADGNDWQKFLQLTAMKAIDKDSDGMVSRKEYMDMMAKAWDMNAGKMGVKGDKMTPEQFKQFQAYFMAGAGG